ncbi:MarR family winged helix-turn-helix transcriptional regulator [Rhizohabitans arisaemae]|uniref:MarR family winged helix-turn-helix transcriptional regulator n=1 Tax=Rhizohabitans arisaemae TaxID=2720610 RepID=UPI0024B21152|nr:MarR family transcriptional regulator [Rhizohabitans arisaemae]
MVRVEWPDPEGQEIVERLLAVESALRLHFERTAAEFGLTIPQAQTLVLLPAPQRMGELAGQLGCEPSHVTGIADLLEECGYVRREPDPEDRRAKRLTLTDTGLDIRDRLLGRLFDGAPVVSVLDADQRAQLLALLRIAQEGSPPSVEC